jgi:hypothetical protein
MNWRLHEEGRSTAGDGWSPWVFDAPLALDASSYSPTQPLFTFGTVRRGNLKITFEYEDADSPIAASATAVIDVGRRVRVLSVTPPLKKLSFPVNPLSGVSDGTFRGSLQLPGEPFVRRFSGVVLQNKNLAIGLFEVPVEESEDFPTPISAQDRTDSGRITMVPATL